MIDFFIRTEEIRQDEILDYFAETKKDRQIINSLKSRNPTILVGSRGVGKSFLIRVAEAELKRNFNRDRVFPIYETLTRSSLIITSDPEQFQHWILARLCSRILRTLSKDGLLSVIPVSISILTGGVTQTEVQKTKIEEIADNFEESWKNPGISIDSHGLPSIEAFKDAIEDLCETLKINRFAVFIDEAAHIFLPEQQRQFFTLFRDIRSPYITCNAAVYPGITSYGETFEPIHDATTLILERDVLSDEYVSSMREIVEKQSDSTLLSDIARNGQNFEVLAYAANGNPRILFKTINQALRLNSSQINSIIRNYYRTEIWSEHSNLAEKYIGHRPLIDWGRNFIETYVLPDLQNKNVQYLSQDKKSTCYFWIHRDTPQLIKESLNLLAYTGIVSEHAKGIKATRSEIGTRYAVNLGCLFSYEPTPATTAFNIAKSLTPKRMNEFGANHSAYQSLISSAPDFSQSNMSQVLNNQLTKDIGILDITDFQRDRLRSIELNTLGDVLRSSEIALQKAYLVGPVRSRRMKNAAITSVYEYLSG